MKQTYTRVTFLSILVSLLMKSTIKQLLAAWTVTLLTTHLLWASLISAQSTNNSLVDELTHTDDQALKELQESVQFKQFDSCEDMQSVMEKFIRKNFIKQYIEREQFRDDDWLADLGGMFGDMMEENIDFAADEMAPTLAWQSKSLRSDSDEISTTNLQKQWVDEPEIIKTDGDRIYYFNGQEQTLTIFQTPFATNNNSIDFSRVEELSTITIPTQLSDVEMFIRADQLIIIGTRYARYTSNNQFLDRSSRSVVALFDVSDPRNPTMTTFFDIDGSMRNARMIDEKLYLISYLPVQRYRFGQYGSDTNTSIEFTESSYLPQTVTINDNGKEITSADCSDISYILPTGKTMQQFGIQPEFAVISVIDTDQEEILDTRVVFGNPGEIHMANDALYLTENKRIQDSFGCPAWFACILPRFDGGEYTLVHKFDIGWSKNLSYVDSNLIPGNMLTQYSMDQDSNGNFRILTNTRDRSNRETATNLYILDKKMELAGKLEHIEPGEEFKASRYMGDMLYLVTFPQPRPFPRDPLFAIDISDPTNPTIRGELMIPWYSTYLHPLGIWGEEKEDVQYLVWLGYDVVDTDRGWFETAWVKVDIYEIDFSQQETIESKCNKVKDVEDLYNDCVDSVDTDNIRVSQIDSEILGWVGSRSEALENPRMFVMDSDFNLTLPLALQDIIVENKECSIIYNTQGEEIDKECRDIEEQQLTFVWLQQFSLDTDSGITVWEGINYKELFAKAEGREGEDLTIRDIRNIWSRVWFVGDVQYFVNNDFAHFFMNDNLAGQYLYFDNSLE